MNRSLLIVFSVFLLLCIFVLANSKDKNITSIYSREGFFSYEKSQRLAGVVHSGDLLDISNSSDSTGKTINRMDYNSKLVMITPTSKNVSSNLSKLRILSVNHDDKSTQMPIKFGDTVVIAHNAYIENKNAVRYIKYNDTLQSHQDGEMFRTFKLINPVNASDTSYVKYDSPLLLRRSDNSPNVFMSIATDNTISTKNTLETATKFYLRLKRVYEEYEKNLCICSGEILYP
jgi:hypothetical protein